MQSSARGSLAMRADRRYAGHSARLLLECERYAGAFLRLGGVSDERLFFSRCSARTSERPSAISILLSRAVLEAWLSSRAQQIKCIMHGKKLRAASVSRCVHGTKQFQVSLV